MNSDLSTLEKILKYTFKSKPLLVEALTHKSHKNKPNNERLEFLGDSVVNLSVGRYIFHKFTNYQEGRLSKLRASLVNQESLSKIAKSLNLGDFVLLSTGEEKNNGRHKPSILSDAYEAVIGAIFLEVGLEPTCLIVSSMIEETYKGIRLEDLYQDYKTLLQEFTQSTRSVIPDYEVVQEIGPEHNKIFTVGVTVGKNIIATGTGKSKKQAEQSSAKIAIGILKNE